MDVLRYFHTLSHLTVRQLGYQILYRLYRPRVRAIENPAPDYVPCDAVFQYHNHAKAIDADSAVFLGVRRDVDFDQAWKVGENALWCYHLNYFDDLLADPSDAGDAFLGNLIERWVIANTETSDAAWDPYPVSRRLVNWCKFYWQGRGGRPRKLVLDSILRQADYLSRYLEYHLMANHLFANGKALVFAGAFLGGSHGAKLLQRGLRVVDAEIDEQFLADGAHFERSPMYHNTMTWDLLDLIAMSQSSMSGELRDRGAQLCKSARAALRWAARMAHPDGNIAFFNDSMFGLAPTTKELIAYAARFDSLDMQGLTEETDGIAPRVTDFQDSQFTVVSTCNYKAMLNTGSVAPSYQPGHAHADTFAFEVSLGNDRLFVNVGTSTYTAGTERSYERSTLAHNTVVVGEANSSDVWGGFRVGRRATVTTRDVIIDSDSVRVACAHDGYRRSPSHAMHKRYWLFGTDRIEIGDVVSGGSEDGVAYLYLHPDVNIVQEGGHYLAFCGPQKVKLEFNCGSVALQAYDWRPTPGETMTGAVFVINFSGESIVKVALVDVS